MVFLGSKAFVAGKAGPNYPAPVAAIDVIEKGAKKGRDEALAIEAATFAKIAKTPTAACACPGVFVDQAVKKIAKKQAKAAEAAAARGNGRIRAAGHLHQSAARGAACPRGIIAPKALEDILEAMKKGKQVERGKLNTEKMARTLAAITPTMSYGDFGAVDIAIEAVVENENVKKKVPAVEAALPDGAILTSNTSTISITRLATALKA